MKVKTSELTGSALDWGVGQASQLYIRTSIADVITKATMVMWKSINKYGPEHWVVYSPSTDWSQGGPIIDRLMEKGLHLIRYSLLEFKCRASLDSPNGFYYGPTLLIAAMRCYVASKLGDEVEIPEEL